MSLTCRKKSMYLKGLHSRILASPLYLKQHPEHSRHSINVSRRVKIGNSGSIATTFLSKKGLLPKERGSTFAHSSS